MHGEGWPFTGTGPDGNAEPVRYRLPAALRWGPPLALLVVLPFWVSRTVASGDWASLVGSLCWLALAVAGVALLTTRVSVTLLPGALITHLGVRTQTLTWSDISFLERGPSTLWVWTATGRFPVPSGGPLHRASASALFDEVERWWLACRGEGWQPPAPVPYEPRRDRDGAACFRRLPLTLGGVLWFVVVGMFASTAPPSSNPPRGVDLTPVVLALGLAVLLVVAWRGWARTTVGPDELVVRNLSGVTRIRRADVVDVVDRRVVGGRTALAAVTPHGTVTLSGTETSTDWLLADPEHQRKAEWLRATLVRGAGALPGSHTGSPPPA